MWVCRGQRAILRTGEYTFHTARVDARLQGRTCEGAQIIEIIEDPASLTSGCLMIRRIFWKWEWSVLRLRRTRDCKRLVGPEELAFATRNGNMRVRGTFDALSLRTYSSTPPILYSTFYFPSPPPPPQNKLKNNIYYFLAHFLQFSFSSKER